ncbi:monothiol glutaredoxin grx5 [Mitosporidium daphniae]
MIAIDVLEEASLREAVKELTGWPTIPQIFVKGEFIGGCDILAEMHGSGDLERLLREKALL